MSQFVVPRIILESVNANQNSQIHVTKQQHHFSESSDVHCASLCHTLCDSCLRDYKRLLSLIFCNNFMKYNKIRLKEERKTGKLKRKRSEPAYHVVFLHEYKL